MPASGADSCDRACLESRIDQVLEAMIAHNPNPLMLAKDACYTKNDVALRIGDGMWRTLSARGNYNIYACDPDIPSTMPDILCMSCEAQQKSGWFAFVTEIRNRRFPIVDIERGLVLSFAFFDHNAAIREYPLPDGTMTPNVTTYPQTIHISELFQIRDGKIDQIEAVINKVPYGMKSETWDK